MQNSNKALKVNYDDLKKFLSYKQQNGMAAVQVVGKLNVGTQEEIIRRSKKAALAHNQGRPSPNPANEALVMRPGSSKQQTRGVAGNKSPDDIVNFQPASSSMQSNTLSTSSAFAEKYSSNSATREGQLESRRRSQPL